MYLRRDFLPPVIFLGSDLLLVDTADLDLRSAVLYKCVLGVNLIGE
jgi:hypothetical protein